MFKAAPARVRVPATSANVGPGFDCVGIALTLYDDVLAQVVDEPGIRVDVHGEGADTVPLDHRHLVAKSMLRGFDALGGRPRGVELVCANRIPHGRGLGSSAAAIISGLLLARALVVGGDERLPDSALLELAVAIEGHPDNVAACLHGGVVLAWTASAGAPRTGVLEMTPAPGIIPVVCVPSTAVATKKARALLPETVPHSDAVYNAARSALLVQALTGRPDLLLEATNDRLHQPYRRSAYPRTADLVIKLREAGIPAAVSGAGPTVIALADSHTAASVEAMAGARFHTSILDFDVQGGRVLALDT
ncbi:MAG: homoserine kinase [Actinobacteria bacterium]|uniref:Homoserine kinase n=1 Tax=freshwater metagenome TaxID=449393 RepID=A0A6J7S7I7_9ZZZZ|nr:homoserine kinase [Actinomycetota bacterium]